MTETVTREDFELAGTGLNVFEQDEPVEGVIRWLDTPKSVMEFVLEDDVSETIVISRGGTTTFLVPALTAGVKGIVTLQGAPESHLGIVSREYGIPCIMGVTFDRGVRTDRGEIVPADGTRVCLDVARCPEGRVYVEPGAAEAVAEDVGGSADSGQDDRIRALLERYQGRAPHGSEGDQLIRSGLSTGVLELTEDSLRRRLTVDEANDWSTYAGWNMWDCLSQRATEGESGLIPRQEYESVAFVQTWQRYPDMVRLITDRVGVDGVIDIGATVRREFGTKVNLHHNWSMLFSTAFGRGVAVDLGLVDPADRSADLLDSLQFGRRLYAGMWGGGEMFASMRGYRSNLLGPEWADRFHAERTVIADPEQRRLMQRFNATTELLSFLMHFDNRCGMSDSGPYPTADGGFMIVRDHYIGEQAYSWSDVADGLPYAVTQVMYFKPDIDLDVQLIDLSTLFTKPGNYLKYLTGMAVYARDAWNTPMSAVRLLDDAEMGRIAADAATAADRLYRRIASMTRREKIMAGVQVYYTDFILPFAREAGMWDELVDEHDFHELDPVTSEAYYRLTRDGTAQELVPRLFITGTGYPALPGS